MTVRELSELLDARFPRALSCEWDNDGLQVSPDPDAPVTGVLLALDPCDEAIAEAEKTGCNVILTHHPLIFDPLSEIVADSGQGRRIRRLLSAGISSISCHTRADAAEGGLNDYLAGLLNLTDVVPFADGIPRVGTLREPLTPEAAVSFILGAAGLPGAQYAGTPPKTVSRIAVCGGAGKEYLTAAAEAGADLYLTGELSYHARLDANDLPLLAVEVGHDQSERHASRLFGSFLADAAPALRTVDFGFVPHDGFSGARLDI